MSDSMAKTLVRVPNGHPRQCEAIRPGMGTQCNFEAVPNGRTCIMHGGGKIIQEARKTSLNNYRLGKYQKRMNEFVDSTKLRTVDEEIGILRIVLEEIFEKCNDGVDLLLYSQKISDLVQDITKCVALADKLATKSGMVIGRAEAVIIANKVIDIIATKVKSEQDLLELAEQISDAFASPTQIENSVFGSSNFESSNGHASRQASLT